MSCMQLQLDAIVQYNSMLLATKSRDEAKTLEKQHHYKNISDHVMYSQKREQNTIAVYELYLELSRFEYRIDYVINSSNVWDLATRWAMSNVYIASQHCCLSAFQSLMMVTSTTHFLFAAFMLGLGGDFSPFLRWALLVLCIDGDGTVMVVFLLPATIIDNFNYKSSCYYGSILLKIQL